MERWRTLSFLVLLNVCACSQAQYSAYTHSSTGQSTAVIDFTATLSSNSNSSTGATPSRKQLGNCAIGFSGTPGSLQPTGVPVGQLYCTTAAQTSGEGAGGPSQGVVSATNSGTGILAVDNGMGAGGTDSPVTLTDTYGGTGNDSICTGDPHQTDATIITGLSVPPCVSSGSAGFAESTATGFPNSDVLFPTLYAVNTTGMDAATYYYRDIYFQVTSLSTLHDWEMDINYNSSTTAYGAAGCSGGTTMCGYYGWGTHWNATAQMFQYCPQNCSGWKSFEGIDVTGVNPNLTSYPLTNNHWYHLRQYGHRTPTCNYNSGSNCYFYDYMTIYDVTAATTPITYKLVDAISGLPAGGIPVNHSTWTSGVTPQVQIDMTAANTSTAVNVVSDTVTFYHFQ